MMEEQKFWRLVAEHARQAALDSAPPFCAYAITTGDAATQDTVGGITTNQVTVWLDGAPQTEENRVGVILPYGVAAPAAGQLWMVLWPNYKPPGVLLMRLSQ